MSFSEVKGSHSLAVLTTRDMGDYYGGTPPACSSKPCETPATHMLRWLTVRGANHRAASHFRAVCTPHARRLGRLHRIECPEPNTEF